MSSIQVSGYSPVGLGLGIAAAAAGVIVIGVAGYLTHVNTATVAYSVMGGGGALFVAGVIGLAVTYYCSKREEKLEPEIQEQIVIEVPKPRDELAIDEDLYYQANRETLLHYCDAVKRKEEATALLRAKGKKEGDYTFCKAPSDTIRIFVLDSELNIYEKEIKDPNIWGGTVYDPVYEKMLYPILPEGCSVTENGVDSTFKGYKGRSLQKHLDGDNLQLPGNKIGLVHDLIHWMKGRKNLQLEPSFLFTIIGHTFSLLGKYSYTYQGNRVALPKECEVDFEGTTSALGKNVLMQDTLNDLKNMGYTNEIKAKIEKMCLSAYAEGTVNKSVKELMALLNEGNPITIFTGWTGHSVNITLTKTGLIFTNKGDKAGKRPGLLHYEITVEITEQILSKLLSFNDPSQFPRENVFSDLETLLGLKLKAHYRAGYQKTGCCVFANNRHCSHAAAILLGVDPTVAAKEFKQFRHRLKMYWLDALFILIDSLGHDASLKNELYFMLLSIMLKYKTKKLYFSNENSHVKEIEAKIIARCSEWQKNDNHLYLSAILTIDSGDIPAWEKLLKNQRDSKLLFDLVMRYHAFYQHKQTQQQ